MNEDKIKKDLEEIEIINIELDHRVTKLIAENEHLKQTYKQLYDSIKPARIRSKEQCAELINQVNLKSVEISDLNAYLQEKVWSAHSAYIKHTQEEAVVLRDLVDHIKANYPLDPTLEFALAVTPMNKNKKVRFTEPVTSSRNTITKKASTSNLASNKPMLSSTGVKPSTSASGSQPSGNTKKDKILQTQSSTQKNKVEAHPRKVKSSLKNKDHVVAPKGTAHVQHSKLNANSELKCVKCNGCMLSDNHDLCVLDYINNVNARAKSKSRPTGRTFTIVGNECPLTRITTTTEAPLRKLVVLDNEASKPAVTLVYLRKPRKSKTNVPVSKSKVNAGDNLYTLSLRDMMVSSPICLLSKASKTKYWLWHRRLSHLNFGAINHLARHSLFRGLPKLKFEKDHLCSACALGKSTKKPHKPKSEDTNQEKLYLLHMDLCGLMRVVRINEKKYILVIVDDYSRFTWVKCLRTKDEAPTFIINFLKMIQHSGPALHEMTPANIEFRKSCQTLILSHLAHMGNDPYFGVPIPKIPSNQSLSLGFIHTIVHPDHQISEHNSKWTKDHPLENIIGELARLVSTQLQLHEQDLFCYYDAFLTAVEPKTYKDALTQACSIEAMQEELNKFE
ncbi:retrovirus-related pol polyprotein from transposon TNT 1-94 [Tanacetum coccineum]